MLLLNRIAWSAIHSPVDEGSREDQVARISEQHGARKERRGYRSKGTVAFSIYRTTDQRDAALRSTFDGFRKRPTMIAPQVARFL